MSTTAKAAPGSRTVRVVAAVIDRGGHYLITQRRATAVLPLLWEFPGGRVEADESDEAALRRTLRHRVGVDARIGDKLAERDHRYEGYTVHMALYAATIPLGEVKPVNVRDVRWVTSSELADYQFPAADQKTMDALLNSSDS